MKIFFLDKGKKSAWKRPKIGHCCMLQRCVKAVLAEMVSERGEKAENPYPIKIGIKE